MNCLNIHNYTQIHFKHHHTQHSIINTIMVHHKNIFASAFPLCQKILSKNCHNLHNYTQVRFMRHHKLLHMTTFPHQSESIKNRLHQVISLSTFVESESNWFKHEFQITMDVCTLDVISCHQKNVLFIIFACDVEDFIESFLLLSNIPALVCNRYI